MAEPGEIKFDRKPAQHIWDALIEYRRQRDLPSLAPAVVLHPTEHIPFAAVASSKCAVH